MASTLPSITDCCPICCQVQIVDLPSGGGSVSGEPIYTYDTVADLRNETRVSVLVDDTLATVFDRPNQGAENSGFYYYDSTAIEPDDDISIIQPSSIVGSDPGRWKKFKG